MSTQQLSEQALLAQASHATLSAWMSTQGYWVHFSHRAWIR